MSKVLIFDSGVGGLSIATGIFQTIPNIQLVFASDNHAYPYGTKTTKELIPRVSKVVKKLIAEVFPDIVIIACNTASTIVLPSLRKQFDTPIVGVVPAIKPAVALSQNGHIGVLATPATIKRQYTLDLIESLAEDCQVSLLGSSELVELAERKLHQGKIDKQLLKRIVKPWLDANNKIDTIVLACTHFPLIEQGLNDIFIQHKRRITWVDSTIGIAKRVEFLLAKKTTSKQNTEIANLAIFTKETHCSDIFLESLEALNINNIKILKI